MPLLGSLAKSMREATFPTEILRKAMSDWASQYPEKSLPISARCQGLDVNILEANAFDPQDKVAILNSIALPRAQTKAGTPEQDTKAMPKRRVTQKMCFLKLFESLTPPPPIFDSSELLSQALSETCPASHAAYDAVQLG